MFACRLLGELLATTSGGRGCRCHRFSRCLDNLGEASMWSTEVTDGGKMLPIVIPVPIKRAMKRWSLFRKGVYLEKKECGYLRNIDCAVRSFCECFVTLRAIKRQ
jgi:hypothetical protein